MDMIWSPWRMNYINNKQEGDHCVFCHALEQKDDPDYLILYRGEHVFIMLNRYPYTSGHLMVIPYEHCPSHEDLSPAARTEMMDLITRSTSLIRKVYKPHAFNLGANIGEDGGAGISQHFHFHVVPRWRGDSNFMSVTANTRVFPEEVETSYRRLKEAWDNPD